MEEREQSGDFSHYEKLPVKSLLTTEDAKTAILYDRELRELYRVVEFFELAIKNDRQVVGSFQSDVKISGEGIAVRFQWPGCLNGVRMLVENEIRYRMMWMEHHSFETPGRPE